MSPVLKPAATSRRVIGGDDFGGEVGLVVVAFHNHGAFEVEFAVGGEGEIGAVVIDDAGVDFGDELADGAGLVGPGDADGDDGGGFGEAEAFHEVEAELFLEDVDEGDGEGLAAGDGVLDGLKGIGLGGFGGGEDGEHGGDSDEDFAAVLGAGLKDGGG